MNFSIFPLLLIGAFGAFLIYRNRPRPKIIEPSKLPIPFPSAPTIIVPPSGTKKYNRWIQSSLNQIMETNLAVDGIIGPLTKQVIQAFQELSGLYPIEYGIIGPQTQTAIEQFLEGL